MARGHGGKHRAVLFAVLAVTSASVWSTESHAQRRDTDLETLDTVPWTGLEATTRAYARIIDAVNELPLSALHRPEEVN